MLVIGTGELGGKRLAPAPSRVRGCNSSGEGDGVRRAGVPGASCLTLEGAELGHCRGLARVDEGLAPMGSARRWSPRNPRPSLSS